MRRVWEFGLNALGWAAETAKFARHLILQTMSLKAIATITSTTANDPTVC